jgi:tight adherence protein B
MTAQTWLLAGCLVIGAGALAWPAGAARRRWLFGGTGGNGRTNRLPFMPDVSVLVPMISRRTAVHPHRTTATAAAVAAVAGWVAGGAVAALTIAAYAVLGARAAIRRTSARRIASARAAALDDLSALVADLRAGLPPPEAGPGPGSARGPGAGSRPASGARPAAFAGGQRGERPAEGNLADRRIAALSGAVWRLAERTGAPAADLMERVESDARAADRARASAAAQAAGAQATALLLAALPVGGIALGYGIGADPLRVLLHTPLGAGCAAGAVLLQSAGLAWAARLAGGPGR